MELFYSYLNIINVYLRYKHLYQQDALESLYAQSSFSVFSLVFFPSLLHHLHPRQHHKSCPLCHLIRARRGSRATIVSLSGTHDSFEIRWVEGQKCHPPASSRGRLAWNWTQILRGMTRKRLIFSKRKSSSARYIIVRHVGIPPHDQTTCVRACTTLHRGQLPHRSISARVVRNR
jgi:hypothetical protein